MLLAPSDHPFNTYAHISEKEKLLTPAMHG